ncbi:hypothetical protein PMAYCL1PPCAC_05898 [Pristionchus mayeri]|uniref:Uncharacterized protein n=1 Tax=Pristionchus mayeri TaxID=1317129 RepID=A0AAN5C3G2_9BILA|nr:hypothetical protein PMAYCL1PPCAC_05898 [Pristionchus mayeri]
MNLLSNFSNDSEDNKFYCLNGNQLFLNYGKPLNDLDKAKNTSTIVIPKSVEPYPKRPVKLIAETEEQWTEVAQMLTRFSAGTIAFDDQKAADREKYAYLKSLCCHYFPLCTKGDEYRNWCKFAHPKNKCKLAESFLLGILRKYDSDNSLRLAVVTGVEHG